MVYYLCTENYGNGKKVIDASREGDWMYALSGDEYKVSERQGRIVKRGISKDLTFLIEGSKLMKVSNRGRVEV